MAATVVKRLSLLLAAVLVCLPCANAGNILEALLESPRFDGFADLLHKAGLHNILENQLKVKGELTFFIPRDSFLNHHVDARIVSFLTEKENVGLLAQVLLYHVVPKNLPKAALVPGSYESLNGEVLDITTRLSKKTGLPTSRLAVGLDSPIVGPDAILADNGTAHAIDGFLIPSDIAAKYICPKFGLGCAGIAPAPAPGAPGEAILEVLKTAGFNKLVTAIEFANLSQALGKYPLTLLAPTDEALTKYLDSKPTEAEVKAILSYHVVPKFYSYSDFAALKEGNLTSASELPILFNTSSSGGIVFNPGWQSGDVVAKDLYLVDNVASVQGIDELLYPSSIELTPDGLPILTPPGPAGQPTPPPTTGTGSRLYVQQFMSILVASTLAIFFL